MSVSGNTTTALDEKDQYVEDVNNVNQTSLVQHEDNNEPNTDMQSLGATSTERGIDSIYTDAMPLSARTFVDVTNVNKTEHNFLRTSPTETTSSCTAVTENRSQRTSSSQLEESSVPVMTSSTTMMATKTATSGTDPNVSYGQHRLHNLKEWHESEQHVTHKVDDIAKPHDNWKFNKLLADLNDKISPGELSKLKFMYREDIGKSTRKKISTASELFEIMCERLLISRENLLHLQSLLQILNRTDLLTMTIEYARTRGNVVHFYPAPENPVNGYTFAKFHVALRDYSTCSREDINRLSQKVSELLFVDVKDVLVVGVMPSSSMFITLMIPNIFASILKDFVQNKRYLKELVDLDIDAVAIGGTIYKLQDQEEISKNPSEELSIFVQSRKGKCYVFIQTDDQIIEPQMVDQHAMFESVYHQLREKTTQLHNSEEKCLNLSKQLKDINIIMQKTNTSANSNTYASRRATADMPVPQYNEATYKSSDEVSGCAPCEIIDNISTDASFFCQDCSTYMCKECTSCHTKVLLTRNHTTTRIETATEYSGTYLPNKDRTIKYVKPETKFNIHESTEQSNKTTIQNKETIPKAFSKSTLIEQFNVSLDSDDEPCEIFGILVVDNLVYIADNNNDKVKLFDVKGQYLCQIEFENAYDLTQLNNNKVAVSGDTIGVIVYEENALRLIQTIHTSIEPYGISYHNGQIYAVCRYSYDPSVIPMIQVLTLDGKLKRRIEPIYKGRKVLQSPQYIAINQQTGTIYLTDWYNGIIALTPAGKVTFVQQAFSRKKTCQGVAIGKNGFVFVCGLNDHKLIQMSSDGEEISNIVVDECRNPQAVDIRSDILYLCCQDTDIIRVYSLK